MLRHRVEEIQLPHRQVTEAEVAEARKERRFASIPASSWNFRWHQAWWNATKAKAGSEGPFKMELHALRWATWRSPPTRSSSSRTTAYR